MPTITVKDGGGNDVVIQAPLAPGRANSANSDPVVLATEDLAAINAITTALGTLSVDVDNFPATQPISAAALPLPAGAATEAKQDALIASVAEPVIGRNFFAITPNDSTDIATRPDGIFVGGAGTIAMQGTDDNAATFTVPAGVTLPLSPTRILATGTTATGIVGFTA